MAREVVYNIFMWWAIVGMMLWAGGTFYQMVVIVPLWSPPESLHTFLTQTGWAKTIWNFFGPPWQVARMLPIVGALVAGWPYPRPRLYIAIATGCMTIAVLMTRLYVYRLNEMIFFPKAEHGLSAADVSSLLQRWIVADRIRFAIGLVALFALLQAFRSPIASQ